MLSLFCNYTSPAVLVQSGTEYCGSSEYTKVSQTNGFLSNAITEETGLGSSNCPWLVKAEQGQQISISLWDFAVWSSDKGSISQQSPDKSGLCHIYAYVEEYGTGSSVTLCGGATRESVVYTSETNAIVVKVPNPRLSNPPAYFLLKYEGKYQCVVL